MKAYILDRDKYRCKCCKDKNTRLEVHHILERSKGGTDIPSNLITLCSECHKLVHKGKLSLGKKRLFSRTKHATQVDIIISQLKKWIRTLPVKFSLTVGSLTKTIRHELKIAKAHCTDAVAIAYSRMFSCGKEIRKRYLTKSILFEMCVSKGDYQQTKGKHSEKKIPTGKLFGFRKFDKVKYKDIICWIKGRRSSGYFSLENREGIIHNSAKAIDLTRLSARSSVVVI